MKYVVIANRWDSCLNRQIQQVIGQFDSYVNANIFKKAYDDHYSTTSRIIEDANIN
nr:MAG TPA: hypothetical protein [Caudoviricetes sp.]